MPTVKDLISSKNRKLITVSNVTPIIDALKIMAAANIGCLIVMKDDQYVGIFTERDYARKVVLEGRASNNTSVEEVMATDLPHLKTTDTVDHCSLLMAEKSLRYLPIFENNSLYNIISQSDIIKHTIESQKKLIEHLQDYMSLK
jgi:CBS domain-containing protein